MSDPIEDYLASLRRELGTIPEADDVVAEINDHLREACSSPTCPDAEPARLAERAIERFGEAATVAREVRMERGRLRGTDPGAHPYLDLHDCRGHAHPRRRCLRLGQLDLPPVL